MSNTPFAQTVRGRLRVLRRSEDDKLFIKYGIKDEENDLRKEGRFMALEALYQPVAESDPAAVKTVKAWIQDYVLEGLKELDEASKDKDN